MSGARAVWPRRMRDMLSDVGPSVVLAAVSAHELSYNQAGWTAWVPAQVMVWSLVLRRHGPEAVLVVTLGLAAVGWFGDTLQLSQLAILVALHAVASQRSVARTVVAAAATEAGAVVVAVRFVPSGSINDGVVLLSALVSATLLLGTARRAQRQYLLALEDRAAQLDRDRVQQARIAAAEERARIAREMHDIVAHSVSVMVALSEGAAVQVDTDREAARGSMRQVASTGRQAMTELRRVLQVLRSDVQPSPQLRDPQPDLQNLGALATQFRDAGVPVRLEVSGSVEGLPSALQSSAYRVVQEALTNVLKHADQPRIVAVQVQVTAADLRLRVHDDGRPASDAPPTRSTGPTGPTGRGGNGIRGMRERASLFSGEVSSGPVAEGWLVEGRFPLPARSPSGSGPSGEAA